MSVHALVVRALPGYRGRKSWQRAMNLAVATHRASTDTRDRALASALRQCAVDVATSVAHCGDAEPYLTRLECLVTLAERLAEVSESESAGLLASAATLRRMLPSMEGKRVAGD